jgi:hypothetical protein
MFHSNDPTCTISIKLKMAHLRLPPELLLLVMKQVDHGERFSAAQNSLRNAILVDHEWSEAASHILWHSPPVSALAAVSPDRRQYYANKISELFFEGVEEEGEHHATFKSLSFPRLRTVYIKKVKLKKHGKLHLTQYMQPQLQAFHFLGGGVCEDALITLASSCPALEELRLDEPVDYSSQHLHLEFFKNCKSLEVIHLGHGWFGMVTSELFAGLACHERLVKLDIKPLVQNYAIQEGLSMTSNPFINLQNLHMRIESRSVARLASVTTSLSTLFLIIEDSDHDALASLGSMLNMVHLEVSFLDDTELSPQGFRALGNMEELEVLLIESRGALIDASWMDDDLFTEFVSKLPNLSRLDFKLDSGITTKALTSFARSHPTIESFDFSGEFDLSDWATQIQPLFPNLLRFVIEIPFIDDITERYEPLTRLFVSTQCAEVLQRHKCHTEPASLTDRRSPNSPLSHTRTALFSRS